MAVRTRDTFTFDMPPEHRRLLDRLAGAQGIATAECLRRILAEKLAQLEQQEETTP